MAKDKEYDEYCTKAGIPNRNKTVMKHKHAEIIKAWADGAEVQIRWHDDKPWQGCTAPRWDQDCEYRIKPEYKPDTVELYKAHAGFKDGCVRIAEHWERDNLKLTFDGETGKLKSAEVL